MSSLRLPEPPHKQVRKLAAQESVSIDQLSPLSWFGDLVYASPVSLAVFSISPLFLVHFVSARGKQGAQAPCSAHHVRFTFS